MKERDAEVFRKSASPPCPVRALESYSATSYIRWLFGNKLPREHTILSAAFYSLHKAVGNGAQTNLRSVSNVALNMLCPEYCFCL
jgi:hypothetical protein